MKLTPVGYPSIGGSIYIRKRLNKLSKKRLIDFIVYLALNWHLDKKNRELRLPSQAFIKSRLPRLKVIKRKALSKRKTKRKFSAKQLAAQRLFAKRAKAGTLRRKR